MIIIKQKYIIIEALSELPDLSSAKKVYLDIESQNVYGQFDDDSDDTEEKFGKKLGGLYAWKGDRACGIGVTIDEEEKGYYIPMRHTGYKKNLPVKEVIAWASEILCRCECWINHNIKFDAEMLSADGLKFTCALIDTLSLAKIFDSDRWEYGLKPLTVEWLGYSEESLDRVKAYLQGIKSKSYADVPPDIMGEYCIDDVFRNRELHLYLIKNTDAELGRIQNTEKNMTTVLFDMEQNGLPINVMATKKEMVKCITKIINAGTEIAMFTGEEYTDSNDRIFDLLVNKFSLPVLSTIKEKKDGKEFDTGRPCFDADALALYMVHPIVLSDDNIKRIVEAIKVYRDELHFKSLYLDSFLELRDSNDCIHPSYNAIVRTGRMSCSRPNIQQQTTRSKELIKPHRGFGFISKDYSQIEFRLIVHYIQDELAIRAYNENPNTDFHQWLADLIHCSRKAAKTLNFGMAYGAGKRRVTAGLIANPDIIEEIGQQVALIEDLLPEEKVRVFKKKCADRANEVYELYHERLPGIKATAYHASDVCKVRGYVFNAYGRRRHLASNACHKAFNSIIQGCAMDIMKEAMINLSPRFNSESKSLGLILAANVHDEILIECPLEHIYKIETHRHIDSILETPSIKLSIPIKVEGGIGINSWAETGKDSIFDQSGKYIAGKLKYEFLGV